MNEQQHDPRAEMGWLVRLLYPVVLWAVRVGADAYALVKGILFRRRLRRRVRRCNAAAARLEEVMPGQACFDLGLAIQRHGMANSLESHAMLYELAAKRASEGASVDQIKIELAAAADRQWFEQTSPTESEAEVMV